ncbi:protein of unknown function (plasmid) [Azospirillum baldaniorum]|uniref:Uncharacterized protein n=1 Tax=Azospirillum baldaniorum TaxID=1064539 RepID=A0A9P1JTP6_9PROT|nr:protein of unknown function [Azospirillum baldaniorum]
MGGMKAGMGRSSLLSIRPNEEGRGAFRLPALFAVVCTAELRERACPSFWTLFPGVEPSRSSRTPTPARPPSPKSCCCSAAPFRWPAP